MTKQIIAGVSSAALVLSLAVPVFARGSSRHYSSNDATNTAVVLNVTVANADTGDNVQRARGSRSANLMETGKADSKAFGTVEANTGDCNCSSRRGDVRNTALVGNLTVANAETGDNEQTAGGSSSHRSRHHSESSALNGMETGDATAYADGWVVVNSSTSTDSQ